MKLSFRDLKQQKFTIEAEPTDTIAQVKEKVAAEKGWDASQQKLIYSGKVLADANTVESYKIEEKGFIVCMISKPKAAASKPKEPSTPAATSSSTPAAPAAPPASAPAAPSEQPSTPTPAQSATAAPSTDTTGAGGFNDPSAFLMGNRNESTIREMESMGFGRPEIERALRAAYFNPDRAIEYLLSGIPENIQAQQRQATPAAGTGAQDTPASPPAAAAAAAAPTQAQETNTSSGDEPINLFEAAAQAGQQGRGTGGGLPAGLGAALGARAGGIPAGAGGQGAVNLEFLRNSPHFQQLRQLVQQQPAMLEPFLQQVAEGNPQLAQMISLNPDQFLQLLAEDQEGDGGPLPPGSTAISVTPEERDAIERLCGLGFSRDQVIQAYFACDKNEELAANFLFEQPEDDEE
ncbi:UV excision repair protein rad23 [Exophiala dermatitidis]|uniref:UV excision repair protein RAD23 n=2 Tax=Exophiala dermatitidis TaxID=5970 RepID=H6BZF9_EXODN|nr:UV excision repair protein Rad23 [Exophiala dermatitidis NIH/UT8656]KAJ4514437.1 UV excision repair protein rad23 [Exophiala dermatitidis]EHY57022.1 UV excision repair protein Rad23 [Exophiala dermatitidis NIH/UT8656]KAJ4519965.1 UV excision repair protein rad23 [Exophiala dermatitidis]KAJ4523797.1 UV excision repair protein rad23 [Exophiala dermatitidis]KAJ4537265.1 UV excision repair protein rad23 [Exophiala dermatitidis]